MKTVEEAKNNLMKALPILRVSMEEASKNGCTAGIGIISYIKNGGGNVIVRFEAPEFMEDLAIVLGVGPMTDDERKVALADKILIDLFGK